MQKLSFKAKILLMLASALLALIELKNGRNPPSYVVGTQNFYTITRYNWSSYYALAVYELGQAVAAARQGTSSVPIQPRVIAP